MNINNSNITFDKRDEFNRKAIAEKAITLLVSDINISPMVIDGGWGTGKTEFCHKLINMMGQAESHHLIYVDAFQADHADEPLLTVLAEVLKILPEGEERSSFTKKALPALRYGLKTLAKAGVGHLLRQDSADVVDDFDKEIQKAADKAIDASVESMLKDHVKANESLKSLQTALKEIAAKKPIILFIDELDRCRPDFAVNMLEIIKHTFDVEGVKFVLITNTQQLKASINHCYGHTVDAQRYLDKFLKFNLKLPSRYNINGNTENEVAITHYQILVKKSPILMETKLGLDAEMSFVGHVIKTQDLSLREVETLIRYIEIYQILSGGKALGSNVIFGYILLRLLGVMLFCFKGEIAHEIYKGRSNASELASFLGEGRIVPLVENELRTEHHQVVLAMLAKECWLNSDAFKTEDDHHEVEWENLIRDYFRGGGFPPSKGERLRVVVDTIQVLSLGAK